VKGQRVSRKNVDRLWHVWRLKLRALYAVATPADVRGMLQRRGAGGGEGVAEA
jgi:hypothetical protein